MSLRLRLILMITLVLLTTLAAGSFLLYWHALRKVETEMNAAIQVGSRIAANATGSGEEVTNPRRRMELLVRDFNGDRHLRAVLIDASNMVVISSTLRPPEEPAPRWLYNLLEGDPKTVPVKLPALFSGYGTVMLQTDSQNEVGEVWNDAKLYILIFVMFCGFALAFLYFALGRALSPLRELMAAFERIGSGDYRTRVAVRQPLEIAQLAFGFNQMAGRLEEMEHQNFRLGEQLETVQEEERAELARNLHDEVSPLLFSVDVDAMTARELACGLQANGIVERTESIQRAVADLQMNVKGILGRLRPAGLAALSLKSSIENIVSFWRARHPGVVFQAEIPDRSWGPRLESAVLSIVREALNNAVKHARPRNVWVRVSEGTGSRLTVEICDDGGGLPETTPAGGFGILGMMERASLAGGTLSVENLQKPAGVMVKAQLPLPNIEAREDLIEEPVRP